MDSRNQKFNLANEKKYSNSFKNFKEIPQFYSTFDNFMKNRIKKGNSNENENNNTQYNFSKLMNSLYEYNKKKSNMELSTNIPNIKHQKSFKGISLQNFNDTSIRRHNIYIKMNNTASLFYQKKIDEKTLNDIAIYENIEKIIVKLIDNIKNCSEILYNCNEWIKSFENTEWLKSKIIKVKRSKNLINGKEKSVNLLIISIIILFLRLKINNYYDIINDGKKINDFTDILNYHHKIYLLLCYDFLLEKNYIKNSNDNNYLLGQIKLHLQKNIFMNQTKVSINKELQSNNIIFLPILKAILLEIKNNIEPIIISESIFDMDSSKLIELFKQLYQSKINNNKNNNLILNSLNDENIILNYRNKKVVKKQFLNNETELYETSYNHTFLNYPQNSRSMKSFKSLQFQAKHKDLSNEINHKYNNKGTENIPENNQIQNQTIINPSSYKFILLSNYNKQNSELDINDINKIKKVNKAKLLSQMNNNKPRPPFLTTNILYSKFNKKNFTLILDLDETLIKYQICDTLSQKGKILYRPGLIQFLDKVFPIFDVIIWTVATKDYADKIIDTIEKAKKYFSKRLYREHTTYKNKIYIKDLSNLGRSLDKVIIVDDKENNFCLQRNNGILIAPFQGTQRECQNDYILMDLYNILTKIVYDRSKDVRIGINKYKKEILEKITKINRCENDTKNQRNN